MGKCKVLDIR